MKTLVSLVLALPAVAVAIHCPFDLVQFKAVLKECRLQCPDTRFPIARNGEFENVTVPEHFYTIDDSIMILAMDERIGRRCELRHNKEWSTTGVAQQFKAIMKLVPVNNRAFTIMQIHSKTFRGTDGITYPSGPPFMLYRGDRGGKSDHLWAKLRTSMRPKKTTYFDLGPRPLGFFELKVFVAQGFMSVWLDGQIMFTEDVRHLDVLPRNMFKTGVYAHGTGPQRVEYKELTMGAIDQDELPTAPEDSLKTGKSQKQTSKKKSSKGKNASESTKSSSPSIAPTTSLAHHWKTRSPTNQESDTIGLDSGISRLVLVDAETNQDILVLNDGQVLDLSRLPNFSIRAVAGTEAVDLVIFTVNGWVAKKEYYEPYAIAGDSPPGNYISWGVSPGKYTISATAYTQHGRTRKIGESFTITIAVVPRATESPTSSPTTLVPTTYPILSPTTTALSSRANPPRIVQFILVDVATGRDLHLLMNGDTIDTSIFSNFTIRAVTQPGRIGSVVFLLNNKTVRIENRPPYSISGDIYGGGGFLRWTLDSGHYSIVATPYSKGRGRGFQGVPLSLSITIV